jgi:hypothetical protein
VAAGYRYESTTVSAVLWTRLLGLVDLNSYLPSTGIDLSGWTLVKATSLSADGYTIGGQGIHNGVNEGFVIVRSRCGSADYDRDGDTGTDADILSFFACLAGDCCPACDPDFNHDGDVGTDADIESFFRVLGGGPC